MIHQLCKRSWMQMCGGSISLQSKRLVNPQYIITIRLLIDITENLEAVGRDRRREILNGRYLRRMLLDLTSNVKAWISL